MTIYMNVEILHCLYTNRGRALRVLPKIGQILVDSPYLDIDRTAGAAVRVRWGDIMRRENRVPERTSCGWAAPLYLMPSASIQSGDLRLRRRCLRKFGINFTSAPRKSIKINFHLQLLYYKEIKKQIDL